MTDTQEQTLFSILDSAEYCHRRGIRKDMNSALQLFLEALEWAEIDLPGLQEEILCILRVDSKALRAKVERRKFGRKVESLLVESYAQIYGIRNGD